jgi:protein SCO1/2
LRIQALNRNQLAFRSPLSATKWGRGAEGEVVLRVQGAKLRPWFLPNMLDARSFKIHVVVAILLAFTPLVRSAPDQSAPQTFSARGVILKINTNTSRVTIQHDAIGDYMEAMTMAFDVKDFASLTNLNRGDQATFQLHVTADDSWVDHFQKIGAVSLPANSNSAPPVEPLAPPPDKSLLDYKFTNELGQAVSINDFHGQALAITFFYTRCPLPEYCPRLSKNFQEASQKLKATAGAPTNWHFISVSFDPQADTPQVLKNYGQTYGYDPEHWSFFTGPLEKIAALARGSGVTYETEAGTINHNFRTLIIDPEGHLQMIFPTSGNLSDQIVSEILKATAKKKSPE